MTTIDNETGEVVATSLSIPGTFAPTHWIPPNDLTFQDWQDIGVVLDTMEGSIRWWRGDWLLCGRGRWGEMYAQAMDPDVPGLSYGSLADAVYVSSRFDLSRRRENLSWSHHREVAALPPKEQDAWLKLAEEKGWSKTKLRDQVKMNGKENSPDGRIPGGMNTLFIDHTIHCKVYYIKCPHRCQISLDDGLYCHWCQGWVEGVESGDFTISLLDDGQVMVDGGGYVAEVGDPSGAIERQEKRGQAALVRKQVLPIECKFCTREQIEALGIVFGEPVDDLFVNVELPDGWQVRPTDHSMWSELVDGDGNERASIFYKAAFYDRDAFISLTK